MRVSVVSLGEVLQRFAPSECFLLLLQVLSNDTGLRITLAVNSNRTNRYHLPCADVDPVSPTVNQDVFPRYPVVTSSTTVSAHSATFSAVDANTVRQ